MIDPATILFGLAAAGLKVAKARSAASGGEAGGEGGAGAEIGAELFTVLFAHHATEDIRRMQERFGEWLKGPAPHKNRDLERAIARCEILADLFCLIEALPGGIQDVEHKTWLRSVAERLPETLKRSETRGFFADIEIAQIRAAEAICEARLKALEEKFEPTEIEPSILLKSEIDSSFSEKLGRASAKLLEGRESSSGHKIGVLPEWVLEIFARQWFSYLTQAFRHELKSDGPVYRIYTTMRFESGFEAVEAAVRDEGQKTRDHIDRSLGRRPPAENTMHGSNAFLRETAFNLAVQHLRCEDAQGLYVDRGVTDLFLEYIRSSSHNAFPLVGAAGVGKTWELAQFVKCLPQTFVPILINARLARSLVQEIDSKASLILLGRQSIRLVGLSGLIDELSPSFKLIVIIDGLNEFQIEKEAKGTIKERLWSLLSYLNEHGIKCVLACRVFTWQRSLSDSALLDLMFISGHEIVIRERFVPAFSSGNGEMDSRFGEQRIERYEERVPKFGAALSMFTEVETTQFIRNIADACERQHIPLPNWSQLVPLFHDPFYGGLVAKQLLASLPLPSQPEELLNVYIRSRCVDKGAFRDGDSRLNALLDMAECFVGDDLSLRTFMPATEVLQIMQSEDLESLITSGIVHDDIATEYGEPVILFQHDRVFEYSVFLALRRKFERRKTPLSEQVAFVVQALITLSSEDARDYWLRIVNLMLRRLGADISHDDKYGHARFATLDLLQRISLTDVATRMLLRYIGLRSMGSSIARCLSGGNQEAIDEYLSKSMTERPHVEAIRNAISLTPAASRDAAFRYLRWASSCDDPLTAMRIGHALGELEMPKAAAPILEAFIDRYSDDKRVLNAALWTLGTMGHSIDKGRLLALSKRPELRWRLAQYRKAAKIPDIDET